jgi:hypothetical protein
MPLLFHWFYRALSLDGQISLRPLWLVTLRSLPFYYARFPFIHKVHLLNYVFMVKFEVLTAVTMKISVFWDVTMRSLVDIHRCFERTFCIYEYTRLSWKWRRHIPPKCLQLSVRLHDVTSSKTAMFVLLYCSNRDTPHFFSHAEFCRFVLFHFDKYSNL